MSRISVERILFSVYDGKAEAFFAPFVAPNEGVAIRHVSEMANDRETVFGKHPDDFVLFEVGHWDEVAGKVSATEPVRLVCLVRSLVKEQ